MSGLTSLIRKISYTKSAVNTIYGGGATGWLTFFYNGLFRINRFTVLKADLRKKLPPKAYSAAIIFDYPTLRELELYRAGRGLPREFHCDQFQKVTSCCLGRFKEEPAYIHWIYRKGDFSRFLSIRGDDSAEINYVMTLPEFRGHGIATAAIIDTLHRLREQEIRSVYVVIHDDNVASLKSFNKAGFEKWAATCALGVLNRKIPV